jgi:hypothetical protein
MAMEFEQIWQERLQSSLERELGTEAARQLIAGLGPSDSPAHSSAAWCWRVAPAAILPSSFRRSARPMPPAATWCGRTVCCRRSTSSSCAATLPWRPRFVDIVKANGWGLAGTLNGSTVEATKMPKSGSLLEYLSSTDPDHRRALYCHCPRLRDALALGERMPLDYCYCGAGFYQALWEEILGRPVRVEVVTSVAAGDDACRIRIDLSAQGT